MLAQCKLPVSVLFRAVPAALSRASYSSHAPVRSRQLFSSSSSFSSVLRHSSRRVLPRAPCRGVSKTVPGAPNRKKVTTLDLQVMRDNQKPITMATAYTYGSALHVDNAGIDVLLVGDSLAMVEHGHDTTLPVTMEEMLMHARAVTRGADRPLLVGDMPFGSYEESTQLAIHNALRFLKEGGMDAVKLEGGRSMAATVQAMVERGIAVMGHIGLTPQRISVLGGFRAQGRSARAALNLVEEARLLEAAGCFALVIECVPAAVARAITQAVRIPTIGIGAGAFTSGQVLVYHDLLGMLEHAHHAKVAPRFSKQYAQIGQQIQRALEAYREEVESRAFPTEKHCPYKMNAADLQNFEAAVKELSQLAPGARAIRLAQLLRESDNTAGASAGVKQDDNAPITKLY